MLISLDLLVKKYKLEIKGVAHFGAHLGQEVDSYLSNNIKNIVLFEPQRKIFKILEKKYGDLEQVSLFNFGLGFNNKSVNLNLTKDNDGQSSSILNPKLHKEYYPDIKFTEVENIEIKIYDDLKIKDINFLNIDIQGYELEALKGCEESLKTVDYIFVEVNRKLLYEDSALVFDIDNFLKNYKFLRVETKWASSKLPWGDAFYIKIEHISLLRRFISYCKILIYKINFSYSFIDPYRTLNKGIYRFKQQIRKVLKLNNE